MQSHQETPAQAAWNTTRILGLPISIPIAIIKTSINYFKQAINGNAANRLPQQTQLHLYKHRKRPKLSTVFSLLLILSPTLIKNSPTKKEELIRLIKEKIIIDPSIISLSLKNQCEEQFQQAIVEMADPDELSVPTVYRLFAQENLKFRCSTQEAINNEFNTRSGSANDADKKTDVSGYFDSKFLEIVFCLDSDKQAFKGILFHELLHAENYLLVHTEHCSQSNELLDTSPIFPVTLKKIDEYAQAFYLGYKRIEEFRFLKRKNLDNEIVLTEEKKLLQTYSEAAEKYPIIPYPFVFSPAQYEEVTHKLKKLTPHETHTVKKSDNTYWKVVGIKQPNIVLAEPMNSEDALLYLPAHVRSSLRQMRRHPNSLIDEVRQLNERQSYTLQNLPKRAAQVFFKEVLALREKHIQQCMPEVKEAPRTIKMEL